MENDIVYYHKELQKNIRAVERDETDQDALHAVKENFLKLFDMIKMIMISKQDRYYGLFLMNFDLRIDFTAYHAAGVNIDAFPFRMMVNPLLLGLDSLPEMIYTICHEIEHIVLNHPADGARYNPQKDPLVHHKLNIAMDVSINDRLSKDSKENKASVISEPDDVYTSAYLREEHKLHLKELQAFDYYFERIPDPETIDGKNPKIIIVGNGNNREIITEPKRKNMICLPHWTDSNDPDEISSIIRKFVSDVCEGMSETMRGALPDHQSEALEKLLSPPTISWRQLLKRYVGSIPHGHKKTRTRLSRRQPERYDISGSINDRLIKIVVAIDTSASMSYDDLERVMVEIFDIVGTRLCELTIIECDTEVQHVYKATSVKDLAYEVHGCGGTSFTPVIEHVNANRYFRDAILIYFTDGMGEASIPRPLTLRTMWVLQDDKCRLSVRNPYGEVLVMDPPK